MRQGWAGRVYQGKCHPASGKVLPTSRPVDRKSLTLDAQEMGGGVIDLYTERANKGSDNGSYTILRVMLIVFFFSLLQQFEVLTGLELRNILQLIPQLRGEII